MTLENTSHKSIPYRIYTIRDDDRAWLSLTRTDGYVTSLHLSFPLRLPQYGGVEETTMTWDKTC